MRRRRPPYPDRDGRELIGRTYTRADTACMSVPAGARSLMPFNARPGASALPTALRVLERSPLFDLRSACWPMTPAPLNDAIRVIRPSDAKETQLKASIWYTHVIGRPEKKKKISRAGAATPGER